MQLVLHGFICAADVVAVGTQYGGGGEIGTGQRTEVALVAELADGAVVSVGDEGGDARMALRDEVLHRLVSRFLVGDGDGGVTLVFQRAVGVGVGAADEGDGDGGQIPGGVVEAAA